MNRHICTLLVTVAVALTATTVGAIPQLINYQAVLLDGGGLPVTTTSNVDFTIWSASVGGTQLWTENRNVSPDAEGGFNVLLGSISPIPDSAFDGDAYLGIKISPEPSELSPRTRLVSVGYAFRSGSVDGASGGNITSKVSIGQFHTATGQNAFAVGSLNNATGAGAMALGVLNGASGHLSAVGGGTFNSASDSMTVISGGWNNQASGPYSSSGGGVSNIASGRYSSIAGGITNRASGENSSIVGGIQNAANGTNSFAAGAFAKANHDGSVVISASVGGTFNDSVRSFQDEQIVLRAESGVYFTRRDCDTNFCTVWDSVAASTDHRIFVIGGAWCSGSQWLNSSSREQKENFEDIDRADLLERVASIPIARWNYKQDNPSIQHIGPTAEDFYAQFGVGNNDRSISTIDPAGIALAAIQELHKRNSELSERNARLEAEMAELRAIVESALSDR